MPTFLEKNMPAPLNSYISARNLRKSDLGGMIFGCKHSTMEECLSKQLFGLPAAHFSYVRNVEEGLTLFLFNYSDRKLHGIFEAASRGRLNTESYAWTDGGNQKTPFPAQVSVRTKVKCKPLNEDQFKKIIENNYFQSTFFWFELDHAQTRALTSLFVPLPSPANSMGPLASSSKKIVAAPRAVIPSATGNLQRSYAAICNSKKDLKLPSSLVDENKFASLSFWDEDLEDGSSSRASSNVDICYNEEPVSNWEELADDNELLSSLGNNIDLKNHFFREQEFDEQLQAQILVKIKKLAAEHEYSSKAVNGHTVNNMTVKTSGELPDNTHQMPKKNSISAGMEDLSLMCQTYQRNAKGSKEDVQDSGEGHYEELLDITEQVPEEQSVFAEKEDVATVSLPSQGNPEVLEEVIRELKERTTSLEEKQLEENREVQHLKALVIESGRVIQRLTNRVKELELRNSPVAIDDSFDLFFEQCLGPDNAIYLIGGFNGMSWLSSLDSFSPSLDLLTPLKSMNRPRSYASAVALDGHIFVLGGGDGGTWNDTVECYNRRNDEWSICPPLLNKKGSLAGSTLDGKIYAIGGGDGVQCFSNVEMFDPYLARWINSAPLLKKRFAPAAAELHQVIYAVGGYDGLQYMESAERYDPREAYWSNIPSMKVRRGCHSLVVLNEKLYAIGGFNGDEMISSVETYEPRMSTWAMAEPMHTSRGYSAAAVLSNSLFVIGGVKGDEIQDTVECYKEGTGWHDTGLKSVGLRCFCSAIVF